MAKYRIIIGVLLPIFISINIFGVQVKKIGVSDYKAFLKGSFKGTLLSSRGEINLGPEIKSYRGPDEEYYLSLERDRAGNVYIGTGHSAAVFKIVTDAKGKETIKRIFKSDELDVYGLLALSTGEIIVGTSPSGKIYKIDKKGKISELFDPREKMIWDLKEDKDGNIICAVGGEGGVYRITRSGQGRKIFISEDFHIVNLFVTEDGSILAGSGDRGVIYEIKNNKSKVLYDSDFEEVKGICQDRNGNIYFSATRGGISRSQLLKNIQNAKTKNISLVLEKIKKSPLERSALFCIDSGGLVEKIWTLKDEYIYDVSYSRSNDSILVGTGNYGRIYKVKKDGTFSHIYESDASQVYKLKNTGNGFMVISNNTPRLFLVSNNSVGKGEYYSEVFDMEIQSRIGKLYWNLSAALNSGVTLFIRLGNSKIPDKTWVKWSVPFTNKNDSLVDLSGYRYFQIKAILDSANQNKEVYLKDFSCYYIQSNLKPVVEEIKIRWQKTKASKTGKQPEKSLMVYWQASDPNADKLRFSVYLKKVMDTEWILLEKNITNTRMVLNNELFEDGQYLLKVEADDSFDNPYGSSKSNRLVSSPFIIDSTAPVLQDFKVTGKQISFSVRDDTSNVFKVLYSYDRKDWYAMFPVDMINDSKFEQFTQVLVNTHASRVLFIKVIDEYRNQKVFQKNL